jgi:hypothetical protein
LTFPSVIKFHCISSLEGEPDILKLTKTIQHNQKKFRANNASDVPFPHPTFISSVPTYGPAYPQFYSYIELLSGVTIVPIVLKKAVLVKIPLRNDKTRCSDHECMSKFQIHATYESKHKMKLN